MFLICFKNGKITMKAKFIIFIRKKVQHSVWKTLIEEATLYHLKRIGQYWFRCLTLTIQVSLSKAIVTKYNIWMSNNPLIRKLQ